MNATEFSSHGQAGYTLVEMLVVLALLGLIGLVASGGLQFAGRARDISSAETREGRALAAAQRTLRRWIGDASVAPANSQVQAAVLGSAQEFRFQSDARGAGGGNGSVAVALRIEQKNMRSWINLVLLNGEAGKVPRTESFGPLPAGLRIAYGTVDETGAVGWAQDWTKVDRLPQLVRIAAASDTTDWPEFIVMVRKNEPPGCRYDPVSRGCR